MASGKAAVTPRIQALADEITAGTTDRREQTHLIYDEFRHIGQYMVESGGRGRFGQPVAIATVDQHRHACDTLGLEQRLEQHDVVLAVAVAVFEDAGRVMRLVATVAEDDRDVTNMF